MKKFFIVFQVLVMIVALLTGCGPNDDPAKTTTASIEQTQLTEPTSEQLTMVNINISGEPMKCGFGYETMGFSVEINEQLVSIVSVIPEIIDDRIDSNDIGNGIYNMKYSIAVSFASNGTNFNQISNVTVPASYEFKGIEADDSGVWTVRMETMPEWPVYKVVFSDIKLAQMSSEITAECYYTINGEEYALALSTIEWTSEYIDKNGIKTNVPVEQFKLGETVTAHMVFIQNENIVLNLDANAVTNIGNPASLVANNDGTVEIDIVITLNNDLDIADHQHEFVETGEGTATCTKAGTIEVTCLLCGEKNTQEQKALGHNVKSWEPMGLDGDTGHHHGKCSRCGKTVEANCKIRIKALGDGYGYHYKECTVCGWFDQDCGCIDENNDNICDECKKTIS